MWSKTNNVERVDHRGDSMKTWNVFDLLALERLQAVYCSKLLLYRYSWVGE